MTQNIQFWFEKPETYSVELKKMVWETHEFSFELGSKIFIFFLKFGRYGPFDQYSFLNQNFWTEIFQTRIFEPKIFS